MHSTSSRSRRKYMQRRSTTVKGTFSSSKPFSRTFLNVFASECRSMSTSPNRSKTRFAYFRRASETQRSIATARSVSVQMLVSFRGEVNMCAQTSFEHHWGPNVTHLVSSRDYLNASRICTSQVPPPYASSRRSF